mgnify:CR=1 FL=1
MFPFGWAFAASVSLGTVVALSIFIVLVVHELGHAAIARFCGLQVVGFEFNIVHGKCIVEAPEYEIERALISWGGVMAQTMLFLVFLPLHAFGEFVPEALVRLLAPLAAAFVFLNLLYIIVALLPIAPLDGATAWSLIRFLRNGELRRFIYARRLARKQS